MRKQVIGGQLAKEQLNVNQAIQLVQDILYNNSNKLYDLGLAPKTLATPLPVATSRDESDVATTQVQREADIRHLSSLNCKWLRVCWHDYTSSSKMRLLPMRRVLDLLRRGQDVNFALTSATLGLLPTDMMIPSVGSSGTYFTHVDLSKAVLGPAPGHASVFCEMRNVDGSDLNHCPKTLLRHAIESSKSHGLEFKMGFELELVIMERNPDSSSSEKYLTLRNDGHSWSMARAIADAGREGSFNSALDEILDNLTDAGIDIEGLHPENAPGQYEVILPPKPPMEACESLLTTRLIVEAVAARRGFRMTLIPKPFPFNCGTASHSELIKIPSNVSLYPFAQQLGQEKVTDHLSL